MPSGRLRHAVRLKKCHDNESVFPMTTPPVPYVKPDTPKQYLCNVTPLVKRCHRLASRALRALEVLMKEEFKGNLDEKTLRRRCEMLIGPKRGIMDAIEDVAFLVSKLNGMTAPQSEKGGSRAPEDALIIAAFLEKELRIQAATPVIIEQIPAPALAPVQAERREATAAPL